MVVQTRTRPVRPSVRTGHVDHVQPTPRGKTLTLRRTLIVKGSFEVGDIKNDGSPGSAAAAEERENSRTTQQGDRPRFRDLHQLDAVDARS